MASWAEFERAAPDLAAAARRLMVGDDGVAIAFCATASDEGVPHVSPVCPIFCGDALHLSASAATPKVRDLRANGRFVLHAFLGAQDEELQLAGVAVEVTSDVERASVHDAIPFPAFERRDPIFRLSINRALRVRWENVGQPDTRPVRQRWRDDPRGG